MFLHSDERIVKLKLFLSTVILMLFIEQIYIKFEFIT